MHTVIQKTLYGDVLLSQRFFTARPYAWYTVPSKISRNRFALLSFSLIKHCPADIVAEMAHNSKCPCEAKVLGKWWIRGSDSKSIGRPRLQSSKNSLETQPTRSLDCQRSFLDCYYACYSAQSAYKINKDVKTLYHKLFKSHAKYCVCITKSCLQHQFCIPKLNIQDISKHFKTFQRIASEGKEEKNQFDWKSFHTNTRC